MFKSTVNSLLVLHLSSLTACLSLPTQTEFPSLSLNTSLSLTSTIQTSQTSNLSSLNPPPGFGINLFFNNANALGPIGVYSVAIETVYRLSLQPWSSRITQSVYFGLSPYTEQVLFEPSAREANDFLTGYAVLALYAGVCAMTPPSRNLFYELMIVVSHERTQVGRCTIRSAPPPPGANRFNHTSSSVNISALTANTGRMVDPEDPNFALSWTFTGARLNSRDVFLAVMDGIAAAARFTPNRRCAQLSAATPAGAGRGVVINLSSMKHPQMVGFTYQYASRALLLMSRMMQTENRFGAVGFYMEYQGYKFGEGFLMARPEGGDGAVTVE